MLGADRRQRVKMFDPEAGVSESIIGRAVIARENDLPLGLAQRLDQRGRLSRAPSGLISVSRLTLIGRIGIYQDALSVVFFESLFPVEILDDDLGEPLTVSAEQIDLVSICLDQLAPVAEPKRAKIRPAIRERLSVEDRVSGGDVV